MFKRSLVEVFSISKPSWQCRVREGTAGMVKAKWAPDSRHVITFADFNLHMSVWSLTTRQVHTVRQPKAAPGCLTFSSDSRVLALATRRDCRDHIKLYDTDSWGSVGEFTADTLDLCEIVWAPDDSALCLQDTSLEYRILFYSPTGELLSRLEAYPNALGVKSMSWSPDGALLAVGSYDQCVRFISPITWKAVMVLRHAHPKLQPNTENVACYSERLVDASEDPPSSTASSKMMDKENEGNSLDVCDTGTRAPAHGPGSSGFSKSSRCEGGRGGMGPREKKSTAGRGIRRRRLPGLLKPKISTSKGVEITYVPTLPAGPIPSERPDPSKPNPKLGVGFVCWSRSGRYLATRNDNMSSTLWIWDAEILGLSAVMVQIDAVRSAKWCPSEDSLALCTGNNHVYLWSPEGTSWVDVPSEGMDILGLRWSPDGKALLLLSKDRVCCCVLGETRVLTADRDSSATDPAQSNGLGPDDHIRT